MSLTGQDRWGKPRSNARQKKYARWAINAALQRGDLVCPLSCESCGETTSLEAHHHDYSKPLEVKWLCVRCHKALHHKTHCKHGHELTPDNIYVMYDSGRGSCKTCVAIRTRAYRERVPYAERGHRCD